MPWKVRDVVGRNYVTATGEVEPLDHADVRISTASYYCVP